MTATAQLYVVEVQDRCLAQLAGHAGCYYASPPQSEQQALMLVRVLLGCPQRPLSIADAPWQAAIGVVFTQTTPNVECWSETWV